MFRLKMRILTLAVTAAPFAFFLARLALGTKTGSGSDGNSWN
ncbi:MAG TPA: hypothetical protein VNY33_02095 [Gaiellaceae bacterium]|nr:hypothetical protein [Gaiellaceae bacterium]